MSPGIGLSADSSSFTSLRSTPHRPDQHHRGAPSRGPQYCWPRASGDRC